VGGWEGEGEFDGQVFLFVTERYLTTDFCNAANFPHTASKSAPSYIKNAVWRLLLVLVSYSKSPSHVIFYVDAP
jgi:hypothetical protein